MSASPKPSTVAEYLAAQPAPAQRVLRQVRQLIRRALPNAEEAISYGIPAYRLDGRTVIYFAGWKQHFSLYPVGARLIAAFGQRLAPFEVNDKGTIRFALDAPIPAALITAIAKFRAREEPTPPSASRTKARPQKKDRRTTPSVERVGAKGRLKKVAGTRRVAKKRT